MLPTRFGNVIRSCETYPLKVYGVDSIPAWLRLIAVTPKDYQSLIDDARSQTDFFVNLFFIACVLTIVSGFRIVIDAAHVSQGLQLTSLQWLYPAVCFVSVAVAALAYRGALDRAEAWGDLVRGAFDLYLPALAKQLGYELPAKAAEREKFWDATACSCITPR